MPDTQLPVTEGAARPMFAPLEAPLSNLISRYTELKTKPLSRMVVEAAKELDSDAKNYLKTAEDSDARRAIDSAFKVHRFLSGMFKKATDPANEIRRWSSSVLARWEQERRRIADEERRKREEAARLEQERQRLEEAVHLESLGHKEEAEAHLSSPLPPIAMPEEKVPVGKITGVSVIETYKLDRIIDPKALSAYLVEHPEDLIALFEPKLNEWKRRATSAKGQWAVPGATFVMVPETRNRG